MMKALVQTAQETIVLQNVARPLPTPGTALVEIKAVGICGTDMRAYLANDPHRPPPCILGHEAAGIVRGGPDDGRRVTINPVVTCGQCDECETGRTNLCVHRQMISMNPRDGAFAEFVTIPIDNLITIPDEISFEKAALTEPLACGWHAVRLCHAARNHPLSDTPCLVIGGGAIGVGAALALAAIGARNVTLIESNDMRRARLQTIAGFRTCAPDDPTRPSPSGAVIVIDAVGSAATRKQACTYVAPGGTIAHIGLAEDGEGLDIHRMTLQEIQFIGSCGFTTGDFKSTAQAIFQGRLGALDWIETRPLLDGVQAFADIQAGQVASPKTILTP